MHIHNPGSVLRPNPPSPGSRLALASTGMGLTLLCGFIDWFTGPEIAFSIIYLIPVSLVSWRGGRWLGLAQAIVCGLMWLLVELMTNMSYSHAAIPYWNGLVRVLIFSALAVLMSEVANRRRAERELVLARDQSLERARKLADSETALARQRNILQSVLNSMGEGVLLVGVQGKTVLSNPAADKMLESLVGNKEPANSPFAKILHTRSPEELEMCLPRLDSADEVWLRASSRPLLGSNQEGGGVIVFSDITAQRKLERQIAEVSDREQRRLGQDLHDGLCQHLVGLGFGARTLADRLQLSSPSEAAEVNRMTESIDEAITQARDVARGLYLVQLEAGGLGSALEELAGRVRHRHRINCTFSAPPALPEMDLFTITDLFRIVQEAVTNAVKHAKATEINILVQVNENQIVLEVSDNGIGMSNSGTGAKGMGLHIMQYRARMIGATCTIRPGLSVGTMVSCALPVRL